MDFLDKLTHSEPEGVREVGTVNKLGIRRVNAMAVPVRATSPEEMEATEIATLTAPMFPIPFWDCDGDEPKLEPLMTGDFAALAEAGITPDEWEILVIEDQLEGKRK
jgi:hypothetical protein